MADVCIPFSAKDTPDSDDVIFWGNSWSKGPTEVAIDTGRDYLAYMGHTSSSSADALLVLISKGAITVLQGYQNEEWYISLVGTKISMVSVRGISRNLFVIAL